MFCQKCGKQIPDGAGSVIDGQLLCAECAKASVKCFCQRCGRELPYDTPLQENGKLLCESCAALPDDSGEDQAFRGSDRNRGKFAQLGMLPVWLAGLLLVLVVGAVAVLFGTRTLCFHDWVPATCQQAEYCTKCGRIHGDPIPHKWKEATCTEPRTCLLCGVTEGEALGHNWADATCTEPRTCILCGKTEGKALGHSWEPADCQHPKTCSICGATEGEPGKHQWKNADCEHPETCRICGETRGEALGHTWIEATCTAPKICAVCSKTEGEAAGHQWRAATVLEPKTCMVCGATEGMPLSIMDMTPIELMSVTRGDFIGATGDAHHEPIGCDQCYNNSSTLVCGLFPGCVLAYGDGEDSTPNHIHVFSGKLTAKTSVGMTYQKLVDAMGEPQWYLNERDGTASANYTIDGYSVAYVFTDKHIFDDIIDYQMGKTSSIEVSRPRMKVASVKISYA